MLSETEWSRNMVTAYPSTLLRVTVFQIIQKSLIILKKKLDKCQKIIYINATIIMEKICLMGI